MQKNSMNLTASLAVHVVAGRIKIKFESVMKNAQQKSRTIYCEAILLVLF